MDEAVKSFVPQLSAGLWRDTYNKVAETASMAISAPNEWRKFHRSKQ
jgi:hypothetical protein